MMGRVPEIVFSPSEREQLEALAAELGDSAREFFVDVRPHLSDAEWELLHRYTASCVRRALEIGSMLHAVVDQAASATEPYAGRGRSAFVRMALGQWRDCFSPLPDAWRLAEVCEKVPGGEKRVQADVAVLEVMAANRMFGAFDEEYESFFRSTP